MDVHADNAGFSSSIVVSVVVYLVHGITKSEIRIIIVMFNNQSKRIIGLTYRRGKC